MQISWNKWNKEHQTLSFSFLPTYLVFLFCGLQDFKFQYVNHKAFGARFLYQGVDFSISHLSYKYFFDWQVLWIFCTSVRFCINFSLIKIWLQKILIIISSGQNFACLLRYFLHFFCNHRFGKRRRNSDQIKSLHLMSMVRGFGQVKMR